MNPFKLPKLSLRQRLPMLIFALLLTVMLTFGIISYLGVKSAALKVGEERLQTLSLQLSTMLSANAQTLIANTYTAGNKPSFKTYLLSGGKDSIKEVKELLKDFQKDSSYVFVELKNADRTTVLSGPKNEIKTAIAIDSLLSLFGAGTIDSGLVGKIYSSDSNIVYPIITAIKQGGQPIGYLVKWRKMVASSKGTEQLTSLMGSDAKLYIGNADGSLWTDMVSPVTLPVTTLSANEEIIKYKNDNQTVLASIRAVRNSQWVVSIEFPKAEILDAANLFLYWLIISGTILLALALFATWVMSRNITSPLNELTTAAQTIAAGNYSPFIQVDRVDELGKLARAFNAMTLQVRDSQEALQKKAENYKLLFEKNPIPMWIIDRTSLAVIDVNQSAIEHYGYTKEKFLQLNSRDLRPEEDIAKYLSHVSVKTLKKKSGIWRHKTSNDSIIMVDIIAEDIVYESKAARIILANDVTEKLKMEAELIQHRIQQQEIITETTIQAQEKEREEIGKELHDNINQILASTKLYLELARSGNGELLTQGLTKSYENVNLAISEIRQLSKQLVPPSLDSTLIETIKGLIEEIQAATSVSILLTAEDFDETTLNENFKLIIYRIVQEQVNNILKHAFASHVTINIETIQGNVSLRIVDNGVGFDTTQRSKGIGLRNIENRVKFYKGTVRLFSQKGKGCKLEVLMPVVEQKSLV